VLDTAVENAVAAGMTVVIAAGNSGPKGSTISSPGVAPDAITVAASSNGHTILPAVRVTGPGSVPSSLGAIESVAGGTAAGCALNVAIGPLSCISEASLPINNKRGCKAAKIPPNVLAGDVALIERGICSFTQKINNAQAAGALSAIIYNQDISENPADGGDALIGMDVTGTSIPSVFVKRSDGLALVSWVTQNPTAQIEISEASEFANTSDVVASFSSRGPTVTGILKPDIAAPGVNIYSGAIKACSEVSDPTGFAAVSGTSQATPHVAGSAALLKQLHPDWTPEQIKSALISSATSQVFDDAAKTTQSDVLEVGGGRVDLGAASSVSVTTDPANLSFGATKLKKTVTLGLNLTVTNVATGGNFAISVNQLNPDPKVIVNPSTTSLSLTQGGSGPVTITVTARKPAAKRDYTGYIVITPSAGSPQRIPYWFQL
ncbi:MAG: S8 family serine peptidase, partial [Blastocatellia bacterium]